MRRIVLVIALVGVDMFVCVHMTGRRDCDGVNQQQAHRDAEHRDGASSDAG